MQIQYGELKINKKENRYMNKKAKRILGLGLGLIFAGGVVFGSTMTYVLTH